jgi:hypothetical protein
MNTQEREAPREVRSLSAQFAILALAFVVMVGFQSFQLVRDRIALSNLRTGQEPTVQQGVKLRQQVNSIATGIAQLADAGDANARVIIDDMRRQGITVRTRPTGAKQ